MKRLAASCFCFSILVTGTDGVYCARGKSSAVGRSSRWSNGTKEAVEKKLEQKPGEGAGQIQKKSLRFSLHSDRQSS